MIGRPLEGISVLDLSQVVSGPICGRLLADLGADVVKLEPPGGDIIRFLQPKVGDDPVSVYFTWVNAGKRSISLDLRTARGAELAQQLALASDVVLENFRPGVAREVRPRRRDPARPQADPDLLLDQRVGRRQLVVAAARVRGDGPGRGRPGRARRPLAQRAPEQSPHVDGDITPGLLAVTGISAALFQRERTGRGPAPRRVDGRSARVHRRVDLHRSRRIRRPPHPRHVELPDLHAWPTAPTSRSWAIRPAACSRSPPRSPTTRSSPRPSRARRRGGSSATSSRRSPTSRRSKRASSCSGSSSSEVRTLQQLADTPWADGTRGVRGGGAGRTRRRRTVPVRPRDHRRARPAPRFGQHTRAVLAERCGLTDDELTQLESDGVIHSSGDVDTARPDWR